MASGIIPIQHLMDIKELDPEPAPGQAFWAPTRAAAEAAGIVAGIQAEGRDVAEVLKDVDFGREGLLALVWQVGNAEPFDLKEITTSSAGTRIRIEAGYPPRPDGVVEVQVKLTRMFLYRVSTQELPEPVAIEINGADSGWLLQKF